DIALAQAPDRARSRLSCAHLSRLVRSATRRRGLGAPLQDPHRDWLAYLLWVRDTAEIAVENGTEALDIDPATHFVRVELKGAQGTETVYARKLVLAGGRDGAGAP